MNISLRYAFVCIYWPQNVLEVEQLSLKRALCQPRAKGNFGSVYLTRTSL